MKIKNSVLFIVISVFSVDSTLAHRLVHETYDQDKKVASALYLDESTGDLVVQKYDLSKSSLEAKEITFPKSVKSFANFYHPVSTLRPEVKETKVVIDIDRSSPEVQAELERTMGLDRAIGSKVMNEISSDIYDTVNNKVIPSGSTGSKSAFAVLSEKSGSLVFAKGSRKKALLPDRISFPQDLINSLASKSTKVFDVSTPGEIDKVSSRINSTLKSYDFNNAQKKEILRELVNKRSELDDKISKMSLVKSLIKNGEKREVFFNFDDGSFYVRVTKNDEILDDDFYPISDDQNLNELKKKMSRLELYVEEEFEESFQDFYVTGCQELEELSSLLPNLDENIANILKVNDKLWGSYLENAVSKKPVVLEDGSIVLAISAMSDSHNLKISLGENGRINEVSFLDNEKAENDGLEVIKIMENGKEYFKIITKDSIAQSEFDQFFFDIEGSAKGGMNLAIYVKGNGENKNIYDKNTYDISTVGNKVTKIEERVHLSSARKDNYPSKISKGKGQGVKTFVFNNFFSLESKRDKLADEVRSAVNSKIDSINKDGKEYLNKSEINNIILNIVNDVETDIPKLKGNIAKLTAKTYEHSYKNFISNLVPKMIEELVPDESDELYTDITNKSMEGLNVCLELAAKKSNEKAAERCMDTYMEEAPVAIGAEVLKYQLKVNDQEALIGTTVSEYTKCIKENYDTTKDMTHVKGCIFKSMFTAVDKDLESVVLISLQAMEDEYKAEGKNVSLSVPRKTLIKARSNLRSCYQEKGLIAPTIFEDNYNQKKLNSLDTEVFKNDLLACSSHIEQAVGRDVSSSLLNYELKGMDIVGADRDVIREKVLEDGYDNCINIQNGISSRALKSGEFSKVEASKCADLITIAASDLVITKTMKDKLGSELWDKLSRSDRAPHLQCYENLKSEARNEYFNPKRDSIYFENESAKCLKDSIVWASFYLGQKELSSIFSSDPLYRKVALTKDQKNYYAKEIQSCFKDKLKSYSTVSDVSTHLDDIQDECTVKLVLSDEASRDIIIPIVEGILEDSDVDPSVTESTKNKIVEKMRANVNNALSKKKLSLDEVIVEFKNVQGEATYIVADATIDKYVQDMIPGENSKIISRELRAKLFDGEHKFKSRLLNSKGEEDLDNTINEMTEVAAINLTGHATRVEALNLLTSGLLKNEKEVDSMASNASNIMEKCLEQRGQDQELKSYLDICVANVKSTVTYNVFADQLKEILYEGEFSSAFTDKERDEIYSKFINKDLKENISKAYEADDLDTLQTSFTLSATSVIGENVLRQSIADIYTANLEKSSPDYQKNLDASIVVSNQANDELQRCLTSLKGTKDANSDECINAARMKATSLVFKDKIKPILSLLSEKKSEQNEFIDNEIKNLQTCVEKKSTKSNEYTDSVNSCLIESIFDLVSNISIVASSSSDLLTDINLKDYKQCLSDEKRNLIKNSKDLDNKSQVRNTLYKKINQKEDFWIQFFNEAQNEDSQMKVEWAIETVQKCALSGVVPEAIASIRKSSALESKLSLDKFEGVYTDSILRKVEDFSRDTLKNGLWLELPPSENSEPSKDIELKTLSKYLDEYLPIMGDYLKKLYSYDSEGSEDKLGKFLKTLKSELKTKKKLSLEEFTELLLDSELIDLVIESEISSFIQKEAREPLAKEGVKSETIAMLGSKSILGEIFKTKEGRAAISDVKEQFIKPMLNGTGENEIPENVVRDVKLLLAKDTRLGGFVETLTGAIVQNKLDDKRPQNFATSGIASLLGYDSTDFSWYQLRSRKKPGVSDKEQPVSKAIDYFGEKILLPILMNEELGKRKKSGLFGSSEVDIIDDRKEEFSGMVEEIMAL